MFKYRSIHIVLVTFLMGLLYACNGNQPAPETVVPPTNTQPLPKFISVVLDRNEIPRYESLEMKITVDAQYANPYDLRQITLDGGFTSPDGAHMNVPGFWDGQEFWRVRFTPSQEGEWNYRLVIKDKTGSSEPHNGSFTVTVSKSHGWLQAGDKVNPEYSGHYLTYHDGTPFYGVGHGDVLTLISGFNPERGFPKFDEMKKAGENYVVWWPLYVNSPINGSYDDYSIASMGLMDLVVKDAQVKNIFLIFTIWDHPELRDSTHAWGTGRWEANGFSKLTDIDSFFTSEESSVWQKNFYRYIIARWGYSPAIGAWQTVSEINGTNSYEQTDLWHDKVNAYFAANDPYRHLTTASMSGDTDWPHGHETMDMPQVHIYDFKNGELDIDAVKSAQITADWTQRMWNRAEKPNWVGEFGVPGNQYYPELFHNSIWAALASGAAMTPAEWNDGGTWGGMTPDMNADISRLTQFVSDIPLARLNPSALQINSGDAQVRGWGVAGHDGGLFWVQDYSMEGKSIEEVRKTNDVRTGVKVEIDGLAVGIYAVIPFDTWQGEYLNSFEVSCENSQPCTAALPNFTADMAFKLMRKP